MLDYSFTPYAPTDEQIKKLSEIDGYKLPLDKNNVYWFMLFSGNPVCVSLTWRETLEELSSYTLIGTNGAGRKIPQFCEQALAKNYKDIL
jgi:hypothetical protein